MINGKTHATSEIQTQKPAEDRPPRHRIQVALSRQLLTSPLFRSLPSPAHKVACIDLLIQATRGNRWVICPACGRETLVGAGQVLRTVRELAERAGVSPRVVRTTLTRLIEVGVIERLRCCHNRWLVGVVQPNRHGIAIYHAIHPDMDVQPTGVRS